MAKVPKPSAKPSPKPAQQPAQPRAATAKSAATKSAAPIPAPATPKPAKGFDTPKTSDLIEHGGKINPSALFRRAKAQSARTITDDEPIDRAMLLHSAAARTDAPGPASSDPSADPATIHDDLAADDDDAPALTSLAPGAAPASAAPAEPLEITFHLTRNLDKRLDKYLCDRITFMSRSQLQDLIEASQVTVNGRVGKNSTKLKRDDMVTVRIPPPPAEHIVPEDIPLDVLLEDEHMVVINKSPDIIVHPARAEKGGTMVNAVAYHVIHRSKTPGTLSKVGDEFARPGVVHRLDRQTSGVIVFAKSDEAHWKLARQFEKRTTDKRYIAVVHGHIEPIADQIDVPLGPHPSREKGYREMHVVRHDHLGKPALSIYRVLGRYTVPGLEHAGTDGKVREGRSPLGHRIHGGKLSLIEVELKTGRTHQIRVHLQSRGHPLLADDMYGGTVLSTDGKPLVERVALHAALLTLRHPSTDAPMTLIAPLPPDLRALIKTLRTLPGAEELDPTPPGTTLSIAGLLGQAV